MMKIIKIIFSLFLSIHYFCDYCICCNSEETVSVTIPSNEWNLQKTKLHAAINATFNFVRPSTFHLVRFQPMNARCNSLTSSNNNGTSISPQWSTGSGTDDSSFGSTKEPRLASDNDRPQFRLANHTYLFKTGPDSSNHRVPLTLWADRSVVVLSIVRMQFPLRGYVCPRLEICPIPWGLMSTMNDTADISTSRDVMCSTILEQVHAGCLDRLNGVHQVVFPLSHGLAITVDRLGDNPGLYNSSLRIVASAGYSLPPGSFTCPHGFFACLPALTITDEDGSSGRHWQQRVCLPNGLRCDGVVNCPNNGSDERDCHLPTPTQFDVVPDERHNFEAFLHTYNTEQLLQAGHTKPPALLSTARLTVFGIGALTLVMLVALTVLVLRSRRRRRRQHHHNHLPPPDKWPCERSVVDMCAAKSVKEPSPKTPVPRTMVPPFESSAADPLIDRSRQSLRAPLAQPDDIATPKHVAIRQPVVRKLESHARIRPLSTPLSVHLSQSSQSFRTRSNQDPNQSRSATALDSSSLV